MKLLKKISQFSLSEAVVLFKVSLYLILFKTTLLLLPFDYFKSFFKWFSSSKNKSENSPEYHHSVITFTQSVGARLPLGLTCLPQALTVKHLLRTDKSILLKIGIIKNKNNLQSHAWVEKEGIVIIGESSKNYVPIWDWS